MRRSSPRATAPLETTRLRAHQPELTIRHMVTRFPHRFVALKTFECVFEFELLTWRANNHAI